MFINAQKKLANTMLYHYTTPEGLLGILQEEEVNLHFTKFTALNDKMEGKVLQKRFLDIFERLYHEGKIEKSELEKLEDCVSFEMGRFTYLIDGKVEEFNTEDTFVCSFSKAQDSLPMWNYYVKDGSYQGYNIGFKNPYICSRFSDKRLIYDIFRLSPIIYSERQFEKFLRKHEDIIDWTTEDFRRCLMQIFCNGVLEHKMECFSHEQEVRMIYTASKEKKKDIKYKVKNGVLVPYLELKFDKAAIQEITVGPLIEQDLAVKNLREFLEQRGYPDVDIKVSEIPIRY